MRRLAMMLLPWRSYQVGLHVTKKLGSIKRLWQIVERKPALCVSGFVSYQMVRDANEAGKSGLGSLLSLGHSPGKTDRIHMKGPGGRGKVEVAVSRVVGKWTCCLFHIGLTVSWTSYNGLHFCLLARSQ